MRPIPQCLPRFFCVNIPYSVPKEEIPDEFWEPDHPYRQPMDIWFFFGGETLETGENGILLTLQDHTTKIWLAPKSELSEQDAKYATHAIGNILSSFDFNHEHKMAMAAYLTAEWFDLIPKEEEEID